ncbi:MAG: glycerol acyltransferase, partial [Bacteroidota bacterium]
MSILTLEEQKKITANKAIYDDLDPAFAEAFVRHVMNLINDVYFRIKYVGFEQPILRNNPNAPVILASNHSGRSVPWDAVAFMSGLLRHFNYDSSKVCRTLIVPALASVGPMSPYFIANFWKKCGGVDATFHNFETMMHHPDANIMLYPEGVPGIGKGWNHRYELQRFSTSFIKMS